LEVKNKRNCGKVLYIKTMATRIQAVVMPKGHHTKYNIFGYYV